MSLLELRAVACVRGGRLLFEGLDLRLGPGGAALVAGPNGAGKSSLIRLAAGLLPAAAGAVGRPAPAALADEGLALDPKLSLARALRFWSRLDGAEAAGAMAAMGLADLADVPVRMLSTGQRKRAVLARVVASGAPLWLLDEPANGLDGDGQSRLEAALAAHRAGGGAVLAASHQPLALPGAERVELG
ncbi:MAG TPA: heme ABC exporter ATP-binding protein CcmA [Allosphingosinicella sp.]|nr:heme ABC exporter ATP-binding protein CcmA [Allosphingosinicella sp.]